MPSFTLPELSLKDFIKPVAFQDFLPNLVKKGLHDPHIDNPVGIIWMIRLIMVITILLIIVLMTNSCAVPGIGWGAALYQALSHSDFS